MKKKKKVVAKKKKFRIIEEAHYEVTAPDGQAALKLFLNAEDRDKRYFIEVKDRFVLDKDWNVIEVDEDEASP
jgi:hypothetical protein